MEPTRQANGAPPLAELAQPTLAELAQPTSQPPSPGRVHAERPRRGALAGRPLFWIALASLVGLVALERLIELGLSTRNARRAFAQGGLEAESRGFYAAMVGVHTAFLVAAPLEVALAGRPFVPALGVPMLGLVGAAMALRYWAIVTLGERWNTRVVVA